MEYLHAEFLVVLGPALLTAILGLLVNTPSLGVSLRSILGSREHVETLLGLMINSAFVGTAAGALFGYGGDSPPMARSNSPTLGHPKFPQAGPPNYDDSGPTAMRAAASLSR
jgi:hypothetical protein